MLEYLDMVQLFRFSLSFTSERHPWSYSEFLSAEILCNRYFHTDENTCFQKVWAGCFSKVLHRQILATQKLFWIHSHLFSHSFIQQQFVKHLFCAGTMCWAYMPVNSFQYCTKAEQVNGQLPYGAMNATKIQTSKGQSKEGQLNQFSYGKHP